MTRSIKNGLPNHIGFIPDGNRRWALGQGFNKEDGYVHGIEPGLTLFEKCREIGIREISIYGFTQDNTKRPSAQKEEFSKACAEFGQEIARRGASLLVLGDAESKQFPESLKPFLIRQPGDMRVNLLVNYGWAWDLSGLTSGRLMSSDISRIELIVRWGGGRRLSGFLPVQSVYADFYVIDDFWPDFDMAHFDQALLWFRHQDRTLGG